MQGQFCFLEAANIVEILRKVVPAGLHVREIHRLVLDLRTNSKIAAPPDLVPLILDTWVGFAPGRAGRSRVSLDAGLTYVSQVCSRRVTTCVKLSQTCLLITAPHATLIPARLCRSCVKRESDRHLTAQRHKLNSCLFRQLVRGPMT